MLRYQGRAPRQAEDEDAEPDLTRVHSAEAETGQICERCAIPVFHVVGRVWRHCKPLPGQRTCGLPPKPVDSE